MDQQDWIALDCQNCGGRLRAPRSAVGTSVGCPTCHAPVKVRTVSTGYTAPQMIVDSRRKIGVTPQAAPQDTEGFKSRIRNATDDVYKVDPDNPVMKRRDNRKAKHGGSLTTWENNGKSSSRSIVQSAGRRQRRIVIGLSVITGALLVTVVGLLVSGKGSISLIPPAPQASSTSGHSTTSAGPQPLEMRSAADFRDKVWKVVSEFCNAPTHRELMSVIRDPERVGPIIRDYYTSGGHTWVAIPVSQVPDPSAFETDKNWTAFKLPLPDFRSRSMAVEETAKGFKVDWESFVAYSEMPWDKLRESKPRTPVLLRAIVRRSGYYNFDFPSEDTHRCFQIYDEARENVIYGYIRRGSDVEKKMEEIMLNTIDVHAIFKVAYPEKSTANNQVNITEIVAKGWILGKDAPSGDLPGTVTPDPAPAAAAKSSGKTGTGASQAAPAGLPEVPPPLPAAAGGTVGNSASTSLLNDPDEAVLSTDSNTSLGTTPGSGPPTPAAPVGRTHAPLPSIR